MKNKKLQQKIKAETLEREKYDRKKRLANNIRKIRQDILFLMVTIIILVAGAYWIGVIFRNNEHIVVALYAASIVIALVMKYTGFFRKKYYTWVVILTLIAMFLIYWLY